MTDMPDYLTDQTEEAILARMLGRVPADLDKSEGSFFWDALAPAAYELFNSAVWAQEVLKRGFASTTFGSYLDLRCEEHGLSRRPAVKAAGQVTFTGRAGMTVPAGTRVATAADPVTNTPSVEFETAGDIVLDAQGQGVADVTAVEAGASGNVAAGAVTIVVSSLSGMKAVANAAAMAGGADAESDESLLNRYWIKVRSPGTSGNKADYIQWAMSVPGVGGAQVEPLWDGPGTVKVVLLDGNKRAASPQVVAAVQESIAPTDGGDGLAPIGAKVTVEAATEVPISLSVSTITYASSTTLDAVKAAIEEGIRDYLAQLAFTDPIVRYNRISAILLDLPSIVDFQNLLVNGGKSNLEMAPGQVAVPGTVTVSG